LGPSCGQPSLACLNELAATASRMAQLARERRWQSLPELDARCGLLVDRLRALEGEDLGPLDRPQVVALAERIRSSQEELARLLRPQFLHLARRMAESQHRA
jgi:hypothetical protein